MSRKLDTSSDFSTIVDHLQSVTLLRPGSSLSIMVNEAFRAPLSKNSERARLGKHEQHDTIWHLPNSIQNYTPDLGDLVLDAEENRWTVLAFRRTIDNARWLLVTRNMVVAHRLKEFIHIDQATFEKDDRANENPIWHPWRTGLPARLELESVEFRYHQEPIGTTRQTVIHLGERILLDHTYRIRHDDGRTFKILRCRPKQERGATFQIEVEEIKVQE